MTIHPQIVHEKPASLMPMIDSLIEACQSLEFKDLPSKPIVLTHLKSIKAVIELPPEKITNNKIEAYKYSFLRLKELKISSKLPDFNLLLNAETETLEQLQLAASEKQAHKNKDNHNPLEILVKQQQNALCAQTFASRAIFATYPFLAIQYGPQLNTLVASHNIMPSQLAESFAYISLAFTTVAAAITVGYLVKIALYLKHQASDSIKI